MTIARSIVVLAIVFAATPVRAQSAEAEAQFADGKRQMKQGNFDEACKRFEASEHLDPAAGTELNLGDCNAKLRKTATAWAWFVHAAGTAKRIHDRKRAAEAKQRSDALEPKLLRLEIVVPDEHKVPGLAITRNGKPIEEALWNQNDPIDPDMYEIAASAAGYAPWTTTIDVTSKSQHVRVPMLDKRPEAPAPVATTATTTTAPPPQAPVTAAPAPTQTHWRKGPLALAIVGVVGLGAGITLGALSSSDNNAAITACQGGYYFGSACTSSAGLSLNSRAHTEALIADVGFGVGGAALAGALIWWFVTGPTTTERIAIVPSIDHGVGLAAAGTF
ncbi:MAG TPA: hypothetical protein VGG28_21425 [Kofleriaceae bacterium]|jgi:hypothetical protein